MDRPVPECLLDAAKLVEAAKSRRAGTIAFTLAGDPPAVCHLASTEAGVEAVAGVPREPPIGEIHIEAERLASILGGRSDAVAEFLAGGIRVRGDLRYLGALAMELELIDHPIIME